MKLNDFSIDISSFNCNGGYGIYRTNFSFTGFNSENGFESDSNQTFEPQYKNGSQTGGSTDFSAMRAEEMKK